MFSPARPGDRCGTAPSLRSRPPGSLPALSISLLLSKSPHLSRLEAVGIDHVPVVMAMRREVPQYAHHPVGHGDHAPRNTQQYEQLSNMEREVNVHEGHEYVEERLLRARRGLWWSEERECGPRLQAGGKAA